MKGMIKLKFLMAKIQGMEAYPDIRGKVIFEESCNGVYVNAHICNLPRTENNIFAFHIHDENGHYNPDNNPHPMHRGDMPPLFSAKGRASLCFVTDRFKLCEIAGKKVVVHLGVDDFTTQPSGNSGEMIATGIIGR